MRSALLILLLTISPATYGAIPKNLPVDSLQSSLNTNPSKRLKALRSEGKEGIRKLHSVAFDDKYPFETRWRALTTLARIAGAECLPDLEKAIQSSDWFMRDAGIKSLEKIDALQARRWARFLLSDPALIVRTTAVGVLRRTRDIESRSLLWEKLYSAQNFRGSQSLWIRRHIVETLAEFAKKSGTQNDDIQKFKKVLKDRDDSLHAPARMALAKLQ